MVDPTLLTIFGFVVLLTMLSFGFGSGIHKRQLAYKERKEAIERERADAGAGGSGAQFKQLEERVRVLERIATDRGQLLSSEIDALRDSIAEHDLPEPAKQIEGEVQ